MRDVFEAKFLSFRASMTPSQCVTSGGSITKRSAKPPPVRRARRAGRQSRFAFGRFVNDHKKLALVTFREEIAG